MEDEPEVAIVLETNIGKIALRWTNTLIRSFLDDTYNHIEYKHDKDNRVYAFMIGEKVIELLRNNFYPEYFEPEVDDSTFEWYVGHNTKNIDQEIENFYK